MEQTAERLSSIIRLKYNALDEAGAEVIFPEDLAIATFNEIDPDKDSPSLVKIAAILELKQLARAVCRKRQADGESEDEDASLFDGQLQERYPAMRGLSEDGSTEGYVLRNHMTVEERRKNINRLRREARAKIRHADALEAETESLIREGKLREEAVAA